MSVLRMKVRLRAHIRRLHGRTFHERVANACRHSFTCLAQSKHQRLLAKSKAMLVGFLHTRQDTDRLLIRITQFYFKVKKLQLLKYKIFALRSSRFNFMVSQLHSHTEQVRASLKM